MLAALVATCVPAVHAATALTQLRLSPDITVTLGGATVVAPDAVASDNLAGSYSLILSSLPGNVAAYHFAGGVHWLVFDTTVTLPGGLVASPRDVVAWNGSAWSLILSGATAGIPDGVMIDALASTNGTDLLLSIDTTAVLGAVTAGPSDIVRYSAGSWSSYLSASAASIPDGLNVDGLEYLPGGHLLLGFDTAGSVGGVSFVSTHILEYTPGAPGTWEINNSPASRDSGWGAGANLRDFWATSAPNRAPTAASDSYATAFNTPLVAPAPGVLSNDSDPDWDTLTVVTWGNPAHGVLSSTGANGQFTYTPNVGYSGIDSFTYSVSDGRGGSASATVSIIVASAPGANRPPVAANDAYSTALNTPLVVSAGSGVLANDSDPDGDVLSVFVWGAPAHGTLSGTGANGQFTYTPNTGYSGADSFTYSASDGRGGVANATVAISVGGAPPPFGGAATPIPTLNDKVLPLLSAFLGLFALFRLRRRTRPTADRVRSNTWLPRRLE